MRTKKEINAEISALQNLKEKVPPTTFFKDSNVEAIEAQIKVLTELMDEDDINLCHFNEHSESAAIFAWEWMTEETDESPSEDWADLVRIVTKDK